MQSGSKNWFVFPLNEFSELVHTTISLGCRHWNSTLLIRLPGTVSNGLNARQSKILIKMPLKGSFKLLKVLDVCLQMSSDFKNCVSVIKLEPHKHVIKLGIACDAGGLRFRGRKSSIAEEPLMKDKIKLSMGYFDSESLIKEQEIGSFKIPPTPLAGQICLQIPCLNMISHWRMLCVINECCRIWRSHLIVLLLLLGYFATMHVSTMQNFSF